jgi:hypothetical protein
MNDRAKNVVSIDDPTTFPLWERIEALGVPVCVAALISDTARVQIPAERFPRVTIALDHIWGLKFDRHFGTLQPLFALAHLPNVYVKIAPNNSFVAREAEADVHMFYQRPTEALADLAGYKTRPATSARAYASVQSLPGATS